MIFKIISSKDANKCILAHSIKLNNFSLKKGKILNEEDIYMLIKNKIENIYVAIKGKEDYSENLSAKKIAKHISSFEFYEPEVNNGRADLFAKTSGMLKVNNQKLFEINSIFPEIAVCTLKNYSIIKKGQLVGNVKILPYAIKKFKVDKILKDNNLKKIFQVSKVKISKIAIIFTSNNISLLKKKKILTAVNSRLKNFNLVVNFEEVCKHNHKDLSNRIQKVMKKNPDLLLIYGESSISDLNDVVPRAVLDSKGKVLSSLLPTDPGNLLLVGSIQKTPLIGVPGCAKSIKRNGFDDVLERLCHGETFTKRKLLDLAEGGLYKTIIRKHFIEKL